MHILLSISIIVQTKDQLYDLLSVLRMQILNWILNFIFQLGDKKKLFLFLNNILRPEKLPWN